MTSLFPYHSRSHYHLPTGCTIARLFDDTLHTLERPFHRNIPYWLALPDIQQCNIGNALGKVTNNKEKFAVEVDVTHFHPEELTVNLRDHELVVEGHHEERDDDSGKIERHFIRKYTLPDDAQLDTLESHLSDKGVLSVHAKKATIGGPPSRTIPIQAAPLNAIKKKEGNK